IRFPGRPWIASSLTLMQTAAGNPYTLGGADSAPCSARTFAPIPSSSAVLTPGRAAAVISSKAFLTIFPMTRSLSNSECDLMDMPNPDPPKKLCGHLLRNDVLPTGFLRQGGLRFRGFFDCRPSRLLCGGDCGFASHTHFSLLGLCGFRVRRRGRFFVLCPSCFRRPGDPSPHCANGPVLSRLALAPGPR